MSEEEENIKNRGGLNQHSWKFQHLNQFQILQLKINFHIFLTFLNNAYTKQGYAIRVPGP